MDFKKGQLARVVLPNGREGFETPGARENKGVVVEVLDRGTINKRGYIVRSAGKPLFLDGFLVERIWFPDNELEKLNGIEIFLHKVLNYVE